MRPAALRGLTQAACAAYCKQVYIINLFAGERMNTEELEALRRDIVVLRRSVVWARSNFLPGEERAG